jgi:hypothetical protein
MLGEAKKRSYIHHVVKVNNKNKGYEKYRNKKMEARVS